MKFKELLPYILITAIWFIYKGFSEAHNLVYIFSSALGGVLGAIGFSYLISALFINNSDVNYSKKRLKAFIITWGVLMFCQVIVYFKEV